MFGDSLKYKLMQLITLQHEQIPTSVSYLSTVDALKPNKNCSLAHHPDQGAGS